MRGGELEVLRRLSRSRARACKLDWTDYEHKGARRNGPCFQDDDGGDEDVRRAAGERMRDWWWDDTGEVGDGAACVVLHGERNTTKDGVPQLAGVVQDSSFP